MIYWAVDSVPELKGMGKTEQKRLFKEMFKESRTRLGKEFWIRVAVLLVIAVALAVFWPIGALIAVILVQIPSVDKGREWLREQGYPK